MSAPETYGASDRPATGFVSIGAVQNMAQNDVAT
jgi:hypothetical protein